MINAFSVVEPTTYRSTRRVGILLCAWLKATKHLQPYIQMCSAQSEKKEDVSSFVNKPAGEHGLKVSFVQGFYIDLSKKKSVL